MITRSEDLVKLKALAKLCSRGFFNDPSLLVVAWRRILEVLVLAMPPVVVEKKVRGKKKKQKKKADPRKMGILNACAALKAACNHVGDFDDARRYVKRAKKGYKEQLGRDSMKAFEATYSLIACTAMTMDEKIEKARDLLKRMERSLGEENVVTLETLNSLGAVLHDNEEYEEAIKVYERCLAGRTKVLGEDYKDTLMTLNDLGAVYKNLGNYEKALEYYERFLEGNEKMLGKNHPYTLSTVMNTAIVYKNLKDYEKAEELYEKALEGKEAQLGKDHADTIRCARNLSICLEHSGNLERLECLKSSSKWLLKEC